MNALGADTFINRLGLFDRRTPGEAHYDASTLFARERSGELV
jgi:hypothetical protein